MFDSGPACFNTAFALFVSKSDSEAELQELPVSV